jgi:hypothetical protein
MKVKKLMKDLNGKIRPTSTWVVHNFCCCFLLPAPSRHALVNDGTLDFTTTTRQVHTHSSY